MTVWLISDTHLNHARILEFVRPNGVPLRPGFSSVKEMNEKIIDNWVSIVKPSDKIYHLGDVVLGDKAEGMKMIGRLPGHKRLIIGNHDSPDMSIYTGYFEGIYSTRLLDGFLMTHIPVHPNSLSAKVLGCIHGHEHGQHPGEFGKNYVDISVENTGYAPVPFETIRDLILKEVKDEPGI